MIKPATIEEVARSYHGHPLCLEGLVARLRKQGMALERLSELELAHDPEQTITDQNHIGGAPFVSELAARAGVTAADWVLDLGSGIGGPARLLAQLFGCRVHGIDASDERCRDAVALTELVRLSHLVSFECADFLVAPLPARYSVVWGQSAWIQIDDKAKLIAQCSRALTPRGRIAFEEACVLRAPHDLDERRALSSLSELWRSSFVSVEAWRALLAEAGFEAASCEDLSGAFMDWSRQRAAVAENAPEQFSPAERAGLCQARDLSAAGLLGLSRIVARRC